MESRRGLRRLTPAAVALALFAVAAGLVGGAYGRARDADSARDALHAEIAVGAIELNRTIDDVVTALVDPNLALASLDVRRSSAPDAVASVAEVNRSLRLSKASPTEAAQGLQRTASSESGVAILGDARDSGRVRVGAAGSGRVLVVRPIYASESAPTTVAERRAALDRLLVADIDAAVLAGVIDARIASGDRYSIDAGGTEVAARGEIRASDGDAVEVPLDLRGAPWSITGRAASQDGLVRFLPEAAGVAFALLVLAIDLAATRNRQRAIDEAAAHDRDLALLVDIGALLQRSLSLAEILPALAITLSERLDLAGCAILLADERGTLVETFVMGERSRSLPRHAGEIGRPPVEVEPDDSVVLAIERASRAVGAMWLLPRQGLSQMQLRTAQAASELAGSAIVNARAYERERETARRMAELDQMKSDFLGTVSHELRTPSTAIQGFASILDASWDRMKPEDRRDLVERIARNARSLSSMLNGLLDFARIERLSVQLELDRMDLGELVRLTVAQNESLLDQHHLEVDATPGLMVLVDPQAVERIVSNMLTNAAKYSPAESIIRVVVEQLGDTAVLWVIDRGPGVPPRERARIFSRFYRGAGQAAVSTRGTGVGLAVVKELVDRLGATVSVDENPEGGARFRVAFRLAPEQAEQEPTLAGDHS